jgi:hypothetical protein
MSVYGLDWGFKDDNLGIFPFLREKKEKTAAGNGKKCRKSRD